MEDSEDDALLLVRELRRGGYEPVYERVYTREAMEKALADEGPWDVIVSDYRMPRFGAPEALAVAREAAAGVPFVVASGKVGEAAAVELMKAGAHDFLTKDQLTLLGPTVERALKESRERRRRDAILEAVRIAAERFLGETTGWEDNVRSVLRRLGEASEVSRVYIFENYVGEDGEVWAAQRYEWVAPGVSTQIDNPLLKALPYRTAGFERWEETLGQGELVYGHTRDLPESEQPELRAEEILSIVVVPIFVEGRWWGFVGFDECLEERDWFAAEMDALKAAASTLGAAVRRRRAEEALRESEEQLRTSEAELRAVFEAMTDAIFVFDSDGRYLKVAPSNPSLLYRSVEELVGKTLHEILPREQADEFLGYIRLALETRGSVYHEYGLRIDGRQMWFESTISPMMQDLVVAVARDVTERKSAEEALRQSERLYRTVIEQVTENICLVDVKTKRIVGSNPAFRKTLGYTPGELKGMTLYHIVAHDAESVDQNVWLTLREGQRFVGQRRYRRKDGSLMDVEASGSIVVRDGRETLCVVAHDVTERARMQRLLEERVATLSAIATRVTLDLPMEDMLDALAEGVVKASTSSACVVASVEETTGRLRPVGAFGLPENAISGLEALWGAGDESPGVEALRKQQSVLVNNVRDFLLGKVSNGPTRRFVLEATWDSAYVVPLVSRGRSLGALNLLCLPGQEISQEEQVFLRAVADQTAVAIENARLFSEVRGKAALEERQKLARELHDSVSQALYGIALGAKTARALVERDPDRAADPLDYVLSLAEAGLAEMRALIFELRPESLEKEGLVAALEKQAAALRARHEIRTDVDLCDEPETSLEVKQAIYRIAQEALHNTVKHARASAVRIKMRCAPGRIDFEIADDGVGFDPGVDFPGHLGLRSMRERASRLGGTLTIQGSPGAGTRICIRIPS